MDLVFPIIVILAITPLPFTFGTSFISGTAPLDAFVKSLIATSQLWVIVSVIILIWNSHRGELRRSVEYLNTQANKPLLVVLAKSFNHVIYGEEKSEEYEYYQRRYSTENKSIIDLVTHGKLITLRDHNVGSCRDEREFKERLRYLESLGRRLSDFKRYSLRMIKSKGLYQCSFIHRLRRARVELKEYENKLAHLIFRVFKSMREHDIEGERHQLSSIEEMILGKLDIRELPEETTITTTYKESIKLIAKLLKDVANDAKRRNEKLCQDIIEIKRGLLEYMEGLQLDLPQMDLDPDS